jgi:hypothetical protein
MTQSIVSVACGFIVLAHSGAQTPGDVRLKLTVPASAFGSKVPLSITVENQSATSEHQVFGPSDAEIAFKIEILPPSQYAGSLRETRLGGAAAYRPETSGAPAIWFSRKRERVRLAPGGQLHREFTLNEIFQGILVAASYRITVHYEEVGSATVDTEVSFEPDRDFLKAVALLESPDPKIRRQAAGFIRVLTKDLQLKNFADSRNIRDYRRAAEGLRAWWKKNRAQLEFVNGQLSMKSGRE